MAGCPGRSEYSVSNRRSFGVAVDSTKIYFTVDDSTANNGGIWSCTQAGCGAAPRLVQRTNPRFVTANDTSVAWFEGAAGSGVHQQAGSLSLGGQTGVVSVAYGAGTNLFFAKSSSVWHGTGVQTPEQIAEGTNVVAVRADASHVYWLNGGASGQLVRCPVGTDCLITPPDVLASNLMNPGGLTLSNDSIYFTTRGDQKVWRLRK